MGGWGFALGQGGFALGQGGFALVPPGFLDTNMLVSATCISHIAGHNATNDFALHWNIGLRLTHMIDSHESGTTLDY